MSEENSQESIVLEVQDVKHVMTTRFRTEKDKEEENNE